jgi:hypothetical protein
LPSCRGVVVLHPLGNFEEHFSSGVFIERWREFRQARCAFLELYQGGLQQLQFPFIDHQKFLFPSPRSLP